MNAFAYCFKEIGIARASTFASTFEPTCFCVINMTVSVGTVFLSIWLGED